MNDAPGKPPPLSLDALTALYRAARIQYDAEGAIWGDTADGLMVVLPVFIVAFETMQAEVAKGGTAVDTKPLRE